MTPNKIFISIKSTDKKVLQIHKKLEKLFFLQLWVAKAIPLLREYSAILDRHGQEKDPVINGKMVQDAECYFIGSISLFLRCFMNQPSTHLNIRDVTKDSELLKCYEGLRTLRDDEFVHWKGIRSEVEMTYSFLPIGEKDCEFAQELSYRFNEKLGPSAEIAIVEKLYNATLAHIEAQRTKSLADLRQHLASSNTLENETELIGPDGRNILKKT